MYFSATFLVVACFVALAASTTPISTAAYNSLARFAQFSSAAYILSPPCTTVLTATVVYDFSVGSAVGYIAVDTQNSEIILAFKGSTTLQDYENDINVALTSYSNPISGTLCFLCEVHEGFYGTWNGVATAITNEIKDLHAEYPSYSIIVTGHSLGGALTPFAALAIKGLKLGVNVQLYSYGQPRVGDITFTNFVDSQIGSSNLFRGTHTVDPVPQLVPKVVGAYNHHGVEYWISADPASVSTTVQCSGDEDSSCNDGHAESLASVGNLFGSSSPHHTYFGVGMGDSCSAA